MATQTRPRSADEALSGGLEAAAERLVEPVALVGAGALGVLLALPLLLVALPVLCGLLWARRTRRGLVWPLALFCAVPACAAVLVALEASHGHGPAALLALATRYVDAHLDAGAAVLATWPDVPWRAVGLAYAGGVWPYALAGGPLLGAAGGLVLSTGWFRGLAESGERNPRPVDADELARLRGTAEPQPVDGFAARRRLTAITALPKQGKTYAWFGLLRARQDGGTWFGRRVEKGKTLMVTEEDRGTFSAKVRAFGIRSRALTSLHAPEFADACFTQEGWPALVDYAARWARRKGCDTLCWDTLTTWAPWAFRGPEHMSYCLRTLKAACGRHKLAGVVILHNRKQQTDLGAVVDMLGTIAGAAAYDVVAGFSREKTSGECTLAVDGRLGEWSCTAVLRDGRYVPVGAGGGHPPAPDPGPVAPTPTPVAPHLRTTLARLLAMGETATGDLLAAEGGSKPGLLGRLAELERLGLVTRRGRGVRNDPVRWTATQAPAAPAPALVVATADPAYDRYLKSPEWAAKRAQALERAGGACEGCGEGQPVAVHHTEYPAVLGEEPLETLRALCAPCHRAAHPRGA